MEYSSEFINHLIDEAVLFSNEIAINNHYPDNITHLLYIIVPAFILKYGTNHKELVKKCFSEIPIVIQDENDKVYQAYYFSIPKRQQNHIVTSKGIVLKNYENIGLMQLLDNLCHEFNHAVNSLQNEIKIDKQLMIRTGIVYNYFDQKTLSFMKKGEEVILEEIINTKQTELIIDIIKSFSQYSISNAVVSNTLYSIYHSIDQNYHSNSYLLESYVCQELLQNKTFLSTLEVLRFDGQVEDIYYFFDNIVGQNGSFLELCRYLNKSLDLQKKLTNSKWFKKSKIERIKEINKKSLEIVQIFNQNTIFK